MARTLRLLASMMPREEASRLLEESLALAREEGDKEGIADSLERLGAHHAIREPKKAAALKEEALGLYRESSNRLGEASALFARSISNMGTDLACSRTCAEEALGIYRELGHKKQVAQMLMFLAHGHLDEETRIAYHTECREICREIGVEIWEAASLRSLAAIAKKRGELERAEALRVEADEIYQEPPIDPELLVAFEQALTEEDGDAACDALRKMF